MMVLCGCLVLELGACALRPSQQSRHEEFERALAEYNKTAEPRERIVCRRERVMNSHFKERVCRYQWQLDEGQMDGRAMIQDIQDNMRITDLRAQGQ